MWLGYALVALACLLIAIPFAWVFLNSIKNQIDIFIGALSFTPTLDNYTDVLFGRRSDFQSNVVNSLIVAGASTAIVLIIGTLAAHSLERLGWAPWLSKAFLGWILVFHMIPSLTLVAPWYVVFRAIGLYDTLSGLVRSTSPSTCRWTVWLMMAFLRDIPRELEEAAMVDGWVHSQAFRLVVLPLAVPGLIAAGVLAFVFSWNEFAVALSLTSRATATVPVGIAQQYEIHRGQMATASIISTIPAIPLMLFGQRFVVQGLTMGSLK